MTDNKTVTIRFRQVVVRKPEYGRFDEYQVVQSRTILSRHDLRSQAERWCEKNGYALASADRP